MAGIPYRDRRAIVESNSVICHEGIRGINGTSFDSNIIITTTEGFDDPGVWRRPQEALREIPISRSLTLMLIYQFLIHLNHNLKSVATLSQSQDISVLCQKNL